jgi:CRP/FNR family cyclic AMP-dependent transcriptional regulator
MDLAASPARVAGWQGHGSAGRCRRQTAKPTDGVYPARGAPRLRGQRNDTRPRSRSRAPTRASCHCIYDPARGGFPSARAGYPIIIVGVLGSIEIEEEALLRRETEPVRAQIEATRRASPRRRLAGEQSCQWSVELRKRAEVSLPRRRSRRNQDPTPRRELALLLEEDPDLGEGLPAPVRRAAREALRAPVITIEHNLWEPPQLDERTAYGLLLLDGLLGRRVRVGCSVATELLACGDILRPWEEPCMWDLVPPKVEWRVFQPSRVAVLDERITRLVGQRPELVVSFSSRLLRRSRYAEYVTAASRLRKVDDRLLLCLWHLASNWGQVTPAGIRMPFRLTHEALGEIVGARRPSVTVAMERLQRRGQVARTAGGGYLLTGDPLATGNGTPLPS